MFQQVLWISQRILQEDLQRVCFFKRREVPSIRQNILKKSQNLISSQTKFPSKFDVCCLFWLCLQRIHPKINSLNAFQTPKAIIKRAEWKVLPYLKGKSNYKIIQIYQRGDPQLNQSKVIRFYLLIQNIILTMQYLPQLTIILIFITLPHSAHSQSCVSTYTFDNSLLDCTFTYDYQDLACTQFNFLACTWDECLYYITVAGQDICVSSQTYTARDWNRCTSVCCDSSVLYPEIPDSIIQCQDFMTSYTNLATIIGWSVFGGVLFIGGMVFLIFLLCKRGCRCRCRCGCCQCEFLKKCFGSLKDFFTKICCDCVLFKRREAPEHAKEGDASKDIEMAINPEMNTPI